MSSIPEDIRPYYLLVAMVLLLLFTSLGHTCVSSRAKTTTKYRHGNRGLAVGAACFVLA